jgi:predicted MFS family arabinose efflux permease
MPIAIRWRAATLQRCIVEDRFADHQSVSNNMQHDSPVVRHSLRDRSDWPAVISIALGTFVMVTSTFLPVAMLAEMGASFGASPGEVGLLIAAPGLTAAVAAPLLLIWLGPSDRRRLIWGFSALIVLSNTLLSVTDAYYVALAARILLGVCVGGMWTFAVASARHLLHPSKQDVAASVIFVGISFGMIAGVPAGAVAVMLASWRDAFIWASVAAATALGLQIVLLRPMPFGEKLTVATLSLLLRQREPRLGFIVSAILATGHFAGYPYLQVALRNVSDTRGIATVTLLVLYGLSGVIGNFGGARLAMKDTSGALLATALLLGGAMLAGVLLIQSLPGAVILVLAWGMAFGAVPVTIQMWMQQAAPSRIEASAAATVTVFQGSVAFGSFVGGVLVDNGGIGMAIGAGGIVALGAAPILVMASIRR